MFAPKFRDGPPWKDYAEEFDRIMRDIGNVANGRRIPPVSRPNSHRAIPKTKAQYNMTDSGSLWWPREPTGFIEGVIFIGPQPDELKSAASGFQLRDLVAKVKRQQIANNVTSHP